MSRTYTSFVLVRQAVVAENDGCGGVHRYRWWQRRGGGSCCHSGMNGASKAGLGRVTQMIACVQHPKRAKMYAYTRRRE